MAKIGFYGEPLGSVAANMERPDVGALSGNNALPFVVGGSVRPDPSVKVFALAHVKRLELVSVNLLAENVHARPGQVRQTDWVDLKLVGTATRADPLD